MLDGRVSGGSQVEYKPFGKPPLQRELGRLRRNKVEEFDGHRAVERRHRDGYSRLLSPYQRALGGVQGLPGPAGRGGSLAGPAGAEEQVAVQASSFSRNLDQLLFGATSRCVQASAFSRNLAQAPFWGNKAKWRR